MNTLKMIDEYTDWLKKEITTAIFGEYVEFTTPFLDHFNDYMQIYVKQNNDGTFSMTDDGYIIGNLISSGMSFKNGTNRKKMLNKIENNFNVSIIGEDITTTATNDNFAQKKHMMIQAMLAIDDLYVATVENVKSMFLEDIETYFNANEIYFTKDFSVLGKTETVYTYDFLLQRTKTKPERFCRGINKLTQDRRDIALFNWADTQDKRGNTGELIIIFNDENTVSDDVLRGLYNYGIKVVPFSRRQEAECLDLFIT